MRPPARGRCSRPGPLCSAAALLTSLTLLALLTPCVPLAAVAANLNVAVYTPDGHAASGIVITVHPLDAATHPAAPVRAVMDQVDRAFKPDLLVIPVGSTVEFPNSDAVSHQIYSFSPAKRFQLPLYRGKPYPPVHFDQPGVVTLGCNIHDGMLGYLLVTDAPWYGRTDPAGGWSAEVPHGRYRVVLWHPRLREGDGELARELTVGETDHAELAVRLSKPLQPAPLANRPRSGDY
jgi:plastocyanin